MIQTIARLQSCVPASEPVLFQFGAGKPRLSQWTTRSVKTVQIDEYVYSIMLAHNIGDCLPPVTDLFG